ncbi:MAG: DUF1552 domain-containing protein [Bradymonadaceae bacterium]
MKYRHHLSRRSFIKGMGSVAIALPFMDMMRASTALAAQPVPDRLVTFFFGLGVPDKYIGNGFVGPLAPLAHLSDKFALIRNMDYEEAKDAPHNNHFDGAGNCFVGIPPVSEDRCGGPSIDQVALQEKGADTPISSLQMGNFFRRNRMTRYAHSTNNDGSPVGLPIERPLELFTRIFGEENPNYENEAEAQKQERYQQSVLDSIVGQYQHIMGDRSGYSRDAKLKIERHLETIRELERRAVDDDRTNHQVCRDPMAPDWTGNENSGINHGGDEVDYVIDTDQWESTFRLNADLYALALRCDMVRYGNVVFAAAGERVVMFGDSIDHHEHWHKYKAGESNDRLELHMEFMIKQMAYFFDLMNDPNYLDPNDKTILDNALFIVGTELGNHARHDIEKVFHMVSGCNGKIRTGETVDCSGRSGVDLYNTCLTAYGVDRRMGREGFYQGDIDRLLL